MQNREIPPTTAEAILAANRTVADPAGPDAVRRLAVDEHGRLWSLNLAMNQCRGDGGTNPWEFQTPAAGFTELAEVETWHPVHAGPGHTVAEVLAQLPDHVREHVTGVQFLDKVSDSLLNPTKPTTENDFLEGWAVYQTRLYRRSVSLYSRVAQPFALPDDAFDEIGVSHLVIQGGRYGDEWKVAVQVFRPKGDGLGEVVGSIWTYEAKHPGAPDDVVEATRQWIVGQLPEEITEGFYKCLNRDTYGPEERDFFAAGRMILLRPDPRRG